MPIMLTAASERLPCRSNGKIGQMEAIPTNTSIFSGRGFLTYLRDPEAVVDVVAGSVWGTDDVARLRTAALVRVRPPTDDQREVEPDGHPGEPLEVRSLGGKLTADDLVLRTVLWLTVAGVPVSGSDLAGPVRDRLDSHLLALLDRVSTGTVSDPGHRELLSLALRRRARELTGYPPAGTQPVIAVLLPTGELPPTLLADLDAQTWGTVWRCPASTEEAAEVLADARGQRALYCTRMGAGLRYGPHHLADLVGALRHSGARVAHSPIRFRPWRGSTWLEDSAAGVEGPTIGGMADGSLWYAVDGPEVPVAPRDGYGVHGANAVPSLGAGVDRVAALRLHHDTPVVLDWLAGAGNGTADPVVPRSYFAIAATPPLRASRQPVEARVSRA